MNDLEAARALECEILGPHRKVMSCGCLMRVQNRLNLELSYPGHPVVYRALGFPVQRCGAHLNNCPYINQVIDE